MIVIVGPRLVPYLPAPIAVRDEENGSTIYSFHTPSDSIGKLGAFHGNFGALVRAYAYISTLGNSLDQVTTDAVINANYIKSQLSEVFDLPYDRTCMHEVVLSAKSLKRDYGISALDICKRLIDYGIHPPTMYFPLIVDEALMIEPTESESKETIDRFIDAMIMISELSKSNPKEIIDAPVNLPVERLDEALAARNPVLIWAKK